MVQQRILVRVLAGGSDVARSGTFTVVDTLAAVVTALFAAEAEQRRRVRIIYGGQVREETDALSDLIPRGAPVPDSLTLHAVIGAPGSADTGGGAGSTSAAGGGGGVGSQSFGAASSRHSGGNDVIEFAGMKLKPAQVLLVVVGAALALLWWAKIQSPQYVSAAATLMLIAFTGLYLLALHNAVMPARTDGHGGAPPLRSSSAGSGSGTSQPADAPPRSAAQQPQPQPQSHLHSDGLRAR